MKPDIDAAFAVAVALYEHELATATSPADAWGVQEHRVVKAGWWSDDGTVVFLTEGPASLVVAVTPDMTARFDKIPRVLRVLEAGTFGTPPKLDYVPPTM
ncbi:MAG: hypothetical protein QM662_11095 [Gordonia sp. (in: high G+C Gram-positive bacteria)]